MSVKKRVEKIVSWVKGDWNRALITALVFSLPFDRIPSVDIFGVTIKLSLLLGVAIITRFAYLVLNKKVSISIYSYQKPILAFLIWMALIVPESINLKRALEVLLFNSFTVAMAFGIAGMFKKEYIKPIIYAILSSSLIIAIFCVYQYMGDIFGLSSGWTGLRDRYTWTVFGFPRVQGASLEPLYLASFLSIPIMLMFTLAIIKNKLLSSKIAIMLLFVFSLILFMTVSRGGIYGFVLAIVFVAILILIFNKAKLKNLIIPVGLVVLAFLTSIVITNYLNKPPSAFTKGKSGANAYVSQIKDVGLDSGDERAQSRARAIQIFKDNKLALLIGVGPGQYGPYVQNNNKQDGWTIVNNLPLEILVETGIIGAGLSVAFFAALFTKIIGLARKSQDETIIIMALGLGSVFVWQAIQYQTYSTLYIIHIWTVVGLTMGLIKYKNGKSTN